MISLRNFTKPAVLLGLLTAVSFWPGQASEAQTQPQSLDGRAIMVNPIANDLRVQASLNKSGSNPVYRPGETISVGLTTTQDAYVYLFSVEADGTIALIYPNQYTGGAQRLRAGQFHRFPAPNSPYQLTITPPFGQAQVVAVASQQPLSTGQVRSLESGQWQTQSTSNGWRAISVGPSQPQQSWVNSVVNYQVR